MRSFLLQEEDIAPALRQIPRHRQPDGAGANYGEVKIYDGDTKGRCRSALVLIIPFWRSSPPSDAVQPAATGQVSTPLGRASRRLALSDALS